MAQNAVVSFLIKQKRWAFAVLALFILFLFIRPFLAPHHVKAISPRPVKTAIALSRDIPISIESFGTLTALNNVNISSQVSGIIKEVRFKEGDNVKRGDLLYLVDPDPYRAELDKSNAALAQDEVDLKLKQDTLVRNAKLVKSNLISEQDFEKYNTDAASAEAKVKSDKAAIEIAAINLGYCSIVAPFDGVAGKRQIDPGNVVTANSTAILVNIKSIDTLYIDFAIPERYLPRLRASLSDKALVVEIVVPEDPNSPYTGELKVLDNTVDNNTGTISMRAVVDNHKRYLWAGQFVTVDLIVGTKKDAVLVPYDAVQMGQKGPYIFVITPENKADLRLVKTGSRQGSDIAIEEGVKAGEKVVTMGTMGLSPDAAVVDITNDASAVTKTR